MSKALRTVARTVLIPRGLTALRIATQCQRIHSTALVNATEVPNQPPQTKLAETRLRRFWKLVAVEKLPEDKGFHITLDSKPLLTPLGTPILVPPTLPTLAYLLAAEWNIVTTGSIRQHTLPLTSLVCRAIDHLDESNPKHIREQVIEELHRYIDTDAILFFAPREQAQGKLTKMQIHEWEPLIRWACDTFYEIYTRSSEGGIANFKRQPWKTRNVLKNWMMTLNGFELAALERCVLTTKSIILSSRLIMEYTSPEKCDGGRHGVESIAQLASLEVRFQTETWGEVEDTHDVDYADIRRQLGSAVALLTKTTENFDKKINPKQEGTTNRRKPRRAVSALRVA